jgi:hypothetical protein
MVRRAVLGWHFEYVALTALRRRSAEPALGCFTRHSRRRSVGPALAAGLAARLGIWGESPLYTQLGRCGASPALMFRTRLCEVDASLRRQCSWAFRCAGLWSVRRGRTMLVGWRSPSACSSTPGQTSGCGSFWSRLETAGVPTLATHTHRRHHPHLSYAVLRIWDLARVQEALGALPPTEPFTMSFHGTLVFPRGRAALAPSITPDMGKTPSHLQIQRSKGGVFPLSFTAPRLTRTPGPPRAFRRSSPARSDGRAEVVRVDVRRCDRGVPQPSLNGDGIDAARQPEAGRGVTQVVDPVTRRSRRPTDRPLHR